MRIFATYGPRCAERRTRARLHRPGVAWGAVDGVWDRSQTRSFCYVDDLIEGIVRLHFSDETRPVNIGNPDEISIAAFAEEILALTGSSVDIVRKPLPVNDPKQRRPDITRAKEVLGWEPKISRQEGLKRTYAYFKGLSDEDLHRSEHKDFESYTNR